MLLCCQCGASMALLKARKGSPLQGNHTQFKDGHWDSYIVARGEERTQMESVAFPPYGNISCCCGQGNLVFHLDMGEEEL